MKYYMYVEGIYMLKQQIKTYWYMLLISLCI